MSLSSDWERFLGNVQATVESLDDPRGLDADGADFDDFQTAVFESLEGTGSTVEEAAAGVDDTVRDLLRQEIRLFNDVVDARPASVGDETLRTRLDQAQTVKESVENVLPLPDWVLDRLDILNELLDLLT